MKQTPERLALAHAYSTCLGRAEALQEALVDLHQRDLHELEWNKLAKEDRRLLDQFAYRYTRIQDDMGTRLMPAILYSSSAGLNPMRLSPEQIAQLRQNAAENLGQETGSPCGHIL
ncbi:hypothetical protein RIE95_10890 [Acidithiobacillus thiooxidans]|uniref:hypothetical protein n=1 Tax=Acidithiobacillus thiooxidans TaxID=930 RepID=UPI0028552F8A|nr:hypothetical protein [Acidithiobacillus thiooxidans]MDR7927480.1 hypothetical protein [Acidithiobacillus thiooxidans]